MAEKRRPRVYLGQDLCPLDSLTCQVRVTVHDSSFLFCLHDVFGMLKNIKLLFVCQVNKTVRDPLQTQTDLISSWAAQMGWVRSDQCRSRLAPWSCTPGPAAAPSGGSGWWGCAWPRASTLSAVAPGPQCGMSLARSLWCGQGCPPIAMTATQSLGARWRCTGAHGASWVDL